jgi:hypothetical protein
MRKTKKVRKRSVVTVGGSSLTATTPISCHTKRRIARNESRCLPTRQLVALAQETFRLLVRCELENNAEYDPSVLGLWVALQDFTAFHGPLRANISETSLVPLINEQ